MKTETKNIQLNYHSVRAMNSQLDMVFWGIDKTISQTLIQTIAELVQQLENTISRYSFHSELYRLNKNAFEKPMIMSTELFQAVQMGVHYYQKTKGYFDVFNGTLFHEWKKGSPEMAVPVRVDGDRVTILEEAKTMRFLQPNVSIDFGGIGKGLALKAIDVLLTSYFIEHALISFGGSSILSRGHHPHGDYWPFTLSHSTEQVWKLNNSFLSVSQCNSTINGNKTPHLVDPKTGETIKDQNTAVVLAANPVDAEVLSTTLLIAPVKEHASILQNFKNIDYQIFKQQP